MSRTDAVAVASPGKELLPILPVMKTCHRSHQPAHRRRLSTALLPALVSSQREKTINKSNPPPSPPPPNQFEAAIHMQESKVRKSASQVILSRMQLTLHTTRRTPQGALRFVHAVTAWSVKARGAQSQHRINARVNGINQDYGY